MKAIIIECAECAAVKARLVGGKVTTVPGTGRLDCGHLESTELGEVDVAQVVHLALSTLLRHPEFLADRDTAHRLQEWLAVPANMRRTNALPWTLQNGHDVSSVGLATARILARAMSSVAHPKDAFYWRAAASVMRKRLD